MLAAAELPIGQVRSGLLIGQGRTPMKNRLGYFRSALNPSLGLRVASLLGVGNVVKTVSRAYDHEQPEPERSQVTLLPECLGDYIAEANPVRVVDVFVDATEHAPYG